MRDQHEGENILLITPYLHIGKRTLHYNHIFTSSGYSLGLSSLHCYHGWQSYYQNLISYLSRPKSLLTALKLTLPTAKHHGMFSEYASKLLTQSQVKFGKDSNVPLFHSAVEEAESSNHNGHTNHNNNNHRGIYSPRRLWEHMEDDEEASNAINASWNSNSGSDSETEGPSNSFLRAVEEPGKSHKQPKESFFPVDFLDREDGQPEEVGKQLEDSEQSIEGEHFFPASTSAAAAAAGVPVDPEHGLNEDSMASSIPPELAPPTSVSDTIKYDQVWGGVYLFMLAATIATYLLALLRGVDGGAPTGSPSLTFLPLTVLAHYTVFAVAISLVWLLLLRKYSSVMFYFLAAAFPVAVWTAALVTLFSGGYSWWVTLGLMITGSMWPLAFWKHKDYVSRAVGIIQLSCRILSANHVLVFLSFAFMTLFVLISAICVTAIGQVMYGKNMLVSALGIFMYMWTWGILNGTQRATISATVSQWYFYRHLFPHTSSRQVLAAALGYALTTQFGSISLSSLLHLTFRIPVLLLSRVVSLSGTVTSVVAPWPLRMVLNVVSPALYILATPSGVLSMSPLTLTLAVINSQNLKSSSLTVQNLHFRLPAAAWRVHKLAKLLLVVVRVLTALLFAATTWVRGHLLWEVVLASFTGWFVLGSTEGLLSMIVDSIFVCFALDSAAQGGHCTAADVHFNGAHEY
ncbi:hypothetical protein LXG23DRAFT_18797 [Yarrowia lipolytica]|nr:hypothetical protein LXG23DRAFT_18797 [Yarrowia lipolytica]